MRLKGDVMNKNIKDRPLDPNKDKSIESFDYEINYEYLCSA